MEIKIRLGRTPSALVLAALILSWSAASALAQDASVVYLEGEPELRTTQGSTEWLDFGTSLRAGESVVTGRNDFVELAYGDASTIEVQPDTVFTVREVERGGERRTVMSNSAGAVKYRFNRLTGRNEPDIGTSSVVAGVRGTEVAVYAGGEGSSLFVVESGEVEVTSAGRTVSLTQDEAVEVPAGGPPGEKYSVIGRELNHADWNANRLDAFLDDPLAGLEGVADRLEEYAVDAAEWYQNYLDAKEVSDAAFAQIGEIEDNEERQEYREETWQPLAEQTGNAVLNYRYHALSALSLRRHALGSMYMEMKTRNILSPTEEYAEFQDRFAEIVDAFDSQADQYLEDTDI
ncbi:MAG TPA: FecR domain-containing protein [Alkalispirochaeta sp.]|nr:FecR domain-containing protein [Alkalispirochaeta sp.]